MIQLEHIKKTYGESVIFRDFSLEIQDGEWIELCGNSGVGKTTLLQMMMGFVCQDQGRILGVPKKISAVFQENRLFETFSVRKNLWLASPKEREKKRLEINCGDIERWSKASSGDCHDACKKRRFVCIG